MKAYRGRSYLALFILNLGTRRMILVKFTPRMINHAMAQVVIQGTYS